MTTDRDDDLGALDLDDMPGVPPLARNARVAAELLFVDPPPAYHVHVSEYRVVVQGFPGVGLDEWAKRQHLDEDETRGEWRVWAGVIEGVPFEATCEVTA